MTGSCIIDGFDIATIGMFVLRGGDLDLLTFPDRKEPQKNEWFEHDGDDVDLTEVYFNAKKTTIKYYLNAVSGLEFITRLEAFQSLMLSSGTRSIYLSEFDKTFMLRYTGCSAFSQKGGLIKSGRKSAEITVDYMMDDPLQIFDLNITEPMSNKANDTFVKLNAIELKNFGITVKKIYDTFLALPDVKEGLVRSSGRMSGQTVDVNFTPKRQSRKLAVDCYMKAATRDEFYRNYNALFNQLAKPQALTVTINNTTDINCYYNSMSGFSKLRAFSNGIFIQFTIHLTEVFL